jgi:hypothetical protein
LPSFSAVCAAEITRANADPYYIGAVCRFNQDDDLIITTRNDEYGRGASVPTGSSARLNLNLAVIQRLKPVRQLLHQELQPLYEAETARELRYRQGIRDSIATKQADYSDEALIVYQRDYVRAGLVGAEWRERAEERVRSEHLAAAEASLRQAKHAYERTGVIEESMQRELFLADVNRSYDRLHGTTAVYPPDYLQAETDGGLPGGHAEENLIRAWASGTAGLTLERVDLFITRMPCPDKSSGMLLNGVGYKEGCINKLIQLVGLNAAVRWEITYHQRLSDDQQALTQRFADRGLPPDRVRFGPVATG